jgi:uncharacterized phage protein (TIGR02220 family)
MTGWIKLHRKLMDNPIFDNPNLLRVWLWCLLKASHEHHQQMVGLQVVDLEPGQFVTGRFKGSDELKINPSTFYKYLKTLEEMQMINLKSSNKMTIVTIENWRKYQAGDTETYQQNNNKITTKEQQSNTNKNNKNVKKKDNIPFAEIIDYLNSKTGKNFKHTTKKTQSLITARMREGFTLEDFKKVIDTKVADWKGTEYAKYLRPETLFGTKFEAYLNQEAPASHDQKKNITAQAPGWDTRL